MTFIKTNQRDGSPKTCKFCHAEVWWEDTKRRWYDPGGETLHVENCPRSQRFYKKAALDGKESQRRKRGEAAGL